MAILHLRLAAVSRSSGANAVAIAARYAASTLIDQRSGQVYDFTHLADVVHQQILGPSDAGDWWRDRQILWNSAEQSEVRRDARVAREYQLGLPHELSPSGRIELAQRWAQFIAERYGNAVDLTVHAPPPDGDPRNHYAKLLATTRKVTATGFDAKVGIEQQNGEQSGPRELRLLHQRWKQMVKEVLLRGEGCSLDQTDQAQASALP